jgi:CubicO group peptidase (beta-lactamase class C family)
VASHSGKAAAVMTGYEGRREGSPEDDQDEDKPHVAGLPDRRDRILALMSVTKSVVGCVAAVLAGREMLDLAMPLTAYVPELMLSSTLRAFDAITAYLAASSGGLITVRPAASGSC